MTDKKIEINNQRRNFIRNSSIAGASAIIAGGMPAVAAAVTTDGADESKKEEGYRLTKHIKDYYKSAAS